MQKIYKTIIFIVFLLVTVIVGLAVAGYVLQDRIIEASIAQLNKQLDATLKVKEVKVSLLRGFPKASVIMRRVEIMEGSLSTPPELEPGLLSLEELTIQIGLVGIFRNEYNINRITLKNGWINLYFDQSGKGNFEIFKSGQQGKGSWLLDIDVLSLDNVNLSYIDLRTGWIFKGIIDNANIKGRASKELVFLHLKARGSVGILRQGSFYYIRNQPASLNTTFIVSPETVIVEPSEATVGGSRFNVDGTLGLEKGSSVNLQLKGDNLSVETLVSLFSQYNFSIPRETKTKGQIAFDLSITGLTKTDTPFNLALNFSSDRLDVQLPEKPFFALRKLKGQFNNGNLGKPESSELTIENIIFQSGSSQVMGSLRFKNVISPLYHINVRQRISIPDLLAWGVNIPVYQGELEGSFEAIGFIENIGSITVQSFDGSKFYSDLTIRNLNFKDVGRISKLENVSGFLKINNQDITSSSLTGKLHGSSFQADIQVTDATALFFKNKKAVVNTNITIDSLNTNWFLAYESPEKNIEYEEPIWERVHSVTGDLFIDQFIHNEFISKPLSASLYIKDNHLFCNSFLGRSCNGLFTGRFSTTSMGGGEYTLNADVNIEGVEIRELFDSFNSFQQDVLTGKNISGRLDGTLVFSTPIKNGVVIKRKFEANSRIKVTDGRLVNVKQLESLSKFIELEELREIRFKDMENEISIRDELIRIPQMNIESSALNIALSGKHTFSGDYLYHIQLLLSDVLFKKASSRKSDNNKFGEVEDDGSGRAKLFLKLEGDSQQHNVSYDMASARTNFRDNMRRERESLKNILRDEFSFLRKPETKQEDSKGNDYQDGIRTKTQEDSTSPQKNAPKFKIEWDED